MISSSYLALALIWMQGAGGVCSGCWREKRTFRLTSLGAHSRYVLVGFFMIVFVLPPGPEVGRQHFMLYSILVLHVEAIVSLRLQLVLLIV